MCTDFPHHVIAKMKLFFDVCHFFFVNFLFSAFSVDGPYAILICARQLRTDQSSNQLQDANTRYLDYINFYGMHQICLKSLCREKIRKCLPNLNRCQHLFYRVPKLGLPAALTQFMLFGISPDEN